MSTISYGLLEISMKTYNDLFKFDSVFEILLYTFFVCQCKVRKSRDYGGGGYIELITRDVSCRGFLRVASPSDNALSFTI